MTLKFYNSNVHLDHNYLEAATKYNLAHWMAVDLYHYATFYKDSFNDYEYKKMLDQYSLASNIFYEAEDYAQFIEGDRKKCLKALYHFTKLTMLDLKIDTIFSSSLDSETEEIRELSMQSRHDNFSRYYKKFLLSESLEYALLIAMEFFINAEYKMREFNSQFEFNDITKSNQLIEDIVVEIMSAKEVLNRSVSSDIYQDSLISEFLISTSKNKTKATNENLLDYINMHKNFLQLWREFFDIHEQTYRLFIDGAHTQDSELEFNTLQVEQYIARINKAAMEINFAILNNMDILLPHVEIYSARAIKGPIDYLTKRNINN